MALCGLLWPCLAFSGNVWPYVALCDLVWSCMAFMVLYSISMASYGRLWQNIVFSRGHWSKFIWSCCRYPEHLWLKQVHSSFQKNWIKIHSCCSSIQNLKITLELSSFANEIPYFLFSQGCKKCCQPEIIDCNKFWPSQNVCSAHISAYIAQSLLFPRVQAVSSGWIRGNGSCVPNKYILYE